eukprot:TRINITY_DN2748_c0_g1_i7.p1 TRINITY_DN2748_c0_g1~~TRINITY_DN2748_c0_g1_i7.p1  ORF type:complete len:204 (+),score=65.75 TRINITY_DN2748_c0_g1_i7:109-720(+)
MMRSCRGMIQLGRVNKGRFVSKKHYKVFKMLFASYDINETGSVSYEEFVRVFEQQHDEQCPNCVATSSGVFAQLDSNSDGQVSFKELLGAYYPSCTEEELDKFIHKYDTAPKAKKIKKRESKLTSEQEEELESVMRLIDLNADGVLDMKEMAFYCANLGIDDNTITEWFSEFDKDQSGTLDFDEFKEFFRREWTTYASSDRIL